MTRFVATAVTTVTPNVAPARRPMSLLFVVQASREAASANGAIPANQSSGSDAAFAPAIRPPATVGTQDLVLVRSTSMRASSTAPNGFVTCAPVVDRNERRTNGPTTSAAAAAVTPAQLPAMRQIAQARRTAPRSVKA